MAEEYPKWVYHATEAARVVEDPAEHLALGPEWVESPADVGTAVEKKRAKR